VAWNGHEEGQPMSVDVLLIEDDQATVKALQAALAPDGFHLDHALPGPHAMRKIVIDDPDVVILGLGSRKQSWQYLCHLLAFVDKPLLLLLSTTDDTDRIKGLELGADDCMVKPVLAEEVVARVRALVRRSGSHARRFARSLFVDTDLVIDLSRREVWLDGQPVALTPTEFRFLFCFAQHIGEVVSHQQLAMHVWGHGCSGERAAIKQYIYQLRQKLEPVPGRPQRIVCRRGQGYVFRSLTEHAARAFPRS
jgi:DNA-binding response OmpR family regulator